MPGSHALRVHCIGVLIFNRQAILLHRNFANSRGLF